MASCIQVDSVYINGSVFSIPAGAEAVKLRGPELLRAGNLSALQYTMKKKKTFLPVMGMSTYSLAA